MNIHRSGTDWRDEYESIVLKYENTVFRAALSMMGSQAEAEDVAQDVFLKLWEKHPFFESSEHQKAWLLKVTGNMCKSRFRSAWFRKTEPLLDTFPAETREEKELLEAVAGLPANYREVIHLYYYEGYQSKEIAQIIGKTESTVRSLMKRAREKLKDMLEGGDYGEFI